MARALFASADREYKEIKGKDRELLELYRKYFPKVDRGLLHDLIENTPSSKESGGRLYELQIITRSGTDPEKLRSFFVERSGRVPACRSGRASKSGARHYRNGCVRTTVLPNHAKVYSSDRKELGRVSGINDDYFVSLKTGLITDEEYRIPIRAVEGVLPGKDEMTIEVGLNEEQLRHGYEIVEGRPGSDLVRGRVESELRIPTGKQLIRYNALECYQHADLDKSKGLRPLGYACDMCNAKFDSPKTLEKHRSKAHKGPVGL